MLTREEDVEIHALHQRGWSISAIARHTGRNRRTIRNYINGVTTPGERKQAGEDRSRRLLTTWAPGCARTRICGRARCAMSLKGSGLRCRIRA